MTTAHDIEPDSRNDLVIVGGGSAGLVYAQVAVGIGTGVTPIEQEVAPGSDCL